MTLNHITEKNIAVGIAVIRLWLVIKHRLGLMVSHLKEIEQGLVLKQKNGANLFLKETIIPANIADVKNIYMPIILLNGQKMKAKGLMLIMDLLYVLNAIAMFTEDGLVEKRNKYPSLTIKRNGEDVTEFWKEKAAQI